MDADWYRADGDDLVLLLRVQPRAKVDAFVGVQGGRLAVRIKAPPVDGKANRHLVDWLAGEFEVKRSAVTIESGESSRQKRARIHKPRRYPPVLFSSRP